MVEEKQQKKQRTYFSFKKKMGRRELLILVLLAVSASILLTSSSYVRSAGGGASRRRALTYGDNPKFGRLTANALHLTSDSVRHQGVLNTKRSTLKLSKAADKNSWVLPKAATGESVRIVAVVSRYTDDISWLTSDAKQFRLSDSLEIAVYQSADIDPSGFPTFDVASVLGTDNRETTLPGWPDWAQEYVERKLSTGQRRALQKQTSAASGAGEEDLLGANATMEQTQEHSSRRMIEKQHLEAGTSNGKGLMSEAAEPARSPVVVAPSLSSLPLHIVPNLGGEAMAYLTAIIDNYHNLPDMMVFFHAHQKSWHTSRMGQDTTLAKIAARPPTNLSVGHMQITCLASIIDSNKIYPQNVDPAWEPDWIPEDRSVARKGEQQWRINMAGHYATAWNETLGALFKMEMPYLVEGACCSTFISTKESILGQPLDVYVSLRNWLLEETMDKYWQGAVMQFTWQILFTKQPVYNPTRPECLCEMYGQCATKSGGKPRDDTAFYRALVKHQIQAKKNKDIGISLTTKIF